MNDTPQWPDRPNRRLPLLAAVSVTVALGAVVFAKRSGSEPLLPTHDFVQFWAAGRLNLRGQDPYDPELLQPLQHEAGRTNPVPVMMWSPPWALTLMMPLGALPSGLAQLVWMCLQLGSVLVCARALWRLYGGPDQYAWVAWAVAVLFAPTAFLLLLGQITGLLLLGLTGFLWGLRRDRLWLAGASVAVCAVKPHLLHLFAAALALQGLRDRRTLGTCLRATVILAAAVLVPLLFNPDVWSQFRAALRRPPSENFITLEQWVHPTLGYEIRVRLPGAPFWAQFIPMTVALVTLLIYWWLRRQSWDWRLELPRLTLAAALTACYGAWTYDLGILLVPLLQATVWLLQIGQPTLTAAFAVAFLAGNSAVLLTLRDGGSLANLWITPVVLVAYLVLAVWPRSKTPGGPAP